MKLTPDEFKQAAIAGWNRERASDSDTWLSGDTPEATDAKPEHTSDRAYTIGIYDANGLKIGSTIALQDIDGSWSLGPYKREPAPQGGPGLPV